ACPWLWAHGYQSSPLSGDLRSSDCWRKGSPLTWDQHSHYGSLLARMRYLNFICSATRSDPSNALNGFKPNWLCDSSTVPDASNWSPSSLRVQGIVSLISRPTSCTERSSITEFLASTGPL